MHNNYVNVTRVHECLAKPKNESYFLFRQSLHSGLAVGELIVCQLLVQQLPPTSGWRELRSIWELLEPIL